MFFEEEMKEYLKEQKIKLELLFLDITQDQKRTVELLSWVRELIDSNAKMTKQFEAYEEQIKTGNFRLVCNNENEMITKGGK